jgi:hypothetical protein
MASTAGKWFLGCGIGCLVLILIVVAIGVGGYFQVKKVVDKVQEADVATREVTDRYGRIREYRPDADGAIRPERMETFLKAREMMAGERESMERSLDLLSRGQEGGGDGSRGGMFAKIRAGAGLIPGIFGFFTQRNEALLEAEMGLGEYTYIYSIAYFSWLGRSPADGPPFVLTGGSEKNEGWDEFEVREARLEMTLLRLNEQLLPMLRHQLEDAGEMDDVTARREWSRALEAEIQAMESDPYRLPWKDGLPEQLQASLEPYRERLDQSYSELCNTLEVGLQGP